MPAQLLLSDLDAHFLTDWHEGNAVPTMDLELAQGLRLQCAKCALVCKQMGLPTFKKEGRHGYTDVHYITIWFSNPRLLQPVPKGSDAVLKRLATGWDCTGLDDLTLLGPRLAYHVALSHPSCKWKGYIIGGWAIISNPHKLD